MIINKYAVANTIDYEARVSVAGSAVDDALYYGHNTNDHPSHYPNSYSEAVIKKSVDHGGTWSLGW
jgi:hypothetical protein